MSENRRLADRGVLSLSLGQLDVLVRGLDTLLSNPALVVAAFDDDPAKVQRLADVRAMAVRAHAAKVPL